MIMQATFGLVIPESDELRTAEGDQLPDKMFLIGRLSYWLRNNYACPARVISQSEDSFETQRVKPLYTEANRHHSSK
jgi:hypothetical protein